MQLFIDSKFKKMKKLLIGFAFFGLFAIALPAKANMTVQPDCKTYTMTCSSGGAYYVIACNQADKDFWASYYCN